MAIAVGTDGWITEANAKGLLAHMASTLGDANSPLTDARLALRITFRFHELNGAARTQGYTVAALYADSSALGYLAGLNAMGAVADVMRSMTGLTAEMSAVAQSYLDDYERGLKDLRAGRLVFATAESTAQSLDMVNSDLLPDADLDANRWTSTTRL